MNRYARLIAAVLAASLPLGMTACSGGGNSAVPAATSQDPQSGSLAERMAAAHARGLWLTSELTAKITPESMPRFLSPEFRPVGGGGGAPSGYTAVSRTVSSYNAYWNPSILQSDTSYVQNASLANGVGYMLRVDYNNGTSAIAAPIANTANRWGIIHPNGTTTVVALQTTSDGGATAGLVSSSVPTSSLVFASPQKLSTWQCSFVIAANGVIVGAIAEALFPEGGPWSWRLGSAGGAFLTGIVAHAVGAC